MPPFSGMYPNMDIDTIRQFSDNELYQILSYICFAGCVFYPPIMKHYITRLNNLKYTLDSYSVPKLMVAYPQLCVLDLYLLQTKFDRQLELGYELCKTKFLASTNKYCELSTEDLTSFFPPLNERLALYEQSGVEITPEVPQESEVQESLPAAGQVMNAHPTFSNPTSDPSGQRVECFEMDNKSNVEALNKAFPSGKFSFSDRESEVSNASVPKQGTKRPSKFSLVKAGKSKPQPSFGFGFTRK